MGRVTCYIDLEISNDKDMCATTSIPNVPKELKKDSKNYRGFTIDSQHNLSKLYEILTHLN